MCVSAMYCKAAHFKICCSYMHYGQFSGNVMMPAKDSYSAVSVFSKT